MVDVIRSWIRRFLGRTEEAVESEDDNDEEEEGKGFIVTKRYR